MRNELRGPRARAILGGDELSGIISVEIESSNHFAADRFRVRFAASAVQREVLHIPGIELEIEIGSKDSWVSTIVGQIDSVNYDPVLSLIDIEGRDLSSRFIEAQSDETFANQTASEIAALLGARHGLLVLADPTTTPVGRYYQSEHDQVTLSQFAKTMSEWDLLALLAVREGFDLFMVGRTLRFGLPVVSGATALSVTDCITLQLGHAIGLARPMDVQVRSWNSKTGKVATGHAFALGAGPVLLRRMTRPNLTSASAQQQAQRSVDDLKRHEWTAAVNMPGELALTARSLVLLEDAAPPWNRLYYTTQILRRLDTKRGFTQTLSLQGVV